MLRFYKTVDDKRSIFNTIMSYPDAGDSPFRGILSSFIHDRTNGVPASKFLHPTEFQRIAYDWQLNDDIGKFFIRPANWQMVNNRWF